MMCIAYNIRLDSEVAEGDSRTWRFQQEHCQMILALAKTDTIIRAILSK